MAICKRCGVEAEPNVCHIFWGGEERRLKVEKALELYFGHGQRKVTLCGSPLSEKELEEWRASYTLNKEGKLVVLLWDFVPSG